MLFIAIRRKEPSEGGGWKNTPGLFYQPRNAVCGAGGGCVACRGSPSAEGEGGGVRGGGGADVHLGTAAAAPSSSSYIS